MLTLIKVEMLCKAVRHYELRTFTDKRSLSNFRALSLEKRAGKIPWKQIVEYMAKRDCYRFGNTAAKKKYVEVMLQA